jgi:hypothetical protein
MMTRKICLAGLNHRYIYDICAILTLEMSLQDYLKIPSFLYKKNRDAFFHVCTFHDVLETYFHAVWSDEVRIDRDSD